MRRMQVNKSTSDLHGRPDSSLSKHLPHTQPETDLKIVPLKTLSNKREPGFEHRATIDDNSPFFLREKKNSFESDQCLFKLKHYQDLEHITAQRQPCFK